MADKTKKTDKGTSAKTTTPKTKKDVKPTAVAETVNEPPKGASFKFSKNGLAIKSL